jgi:hypothetical protein
MENLIKRQIGWLEEEVKRMRAAVEANDLSLLGISASQVAKVAGDIDHEAHVLAGHYPLRIARNAVEVEPGVIEIG